MTFGHWLYRYVDNRGRVPWVVRKLYPYAHWCPEMDGLLCLTTEDVAVNCYCDVVRRIPLDDFERHRGEERT